MEVSRMANHNITSAVMASVPTCQLVWEKTCARNLTDVHKTTPQVTAPRTTATAMPRDCRTLAFCAGWLPITVSQKVTLHGLINTIKRPAKIRRASGFLALETEGCDGRDRFSTLQ